MSQKDHLEKPALEAYLNAMEKGAGRLQVRHEKEILEAYHRGFEEAYKLAEEIYKSQMATLHNAFPGCAACVREIFRDHLQWDMAIRTGHPLDISYRRGMLFGRIAGIVEFFYATGNYNPGDHWQLIAEIKNRVKPTLQQGGIVVKAEDIAVVLQRIAEKRVIQQQTKEDIAEIAAALTS